MLHVYVKVHRATSFFGASLSMNQTEVFCTCAASELQNTTTGFHRSTGKLAPLSPTGATTSIYSPRAESCPGLSIHRRRNLRSVNAQLFLIVASTLSDSVSPQTQFKSVGNAAVGKQSVGELRAWETEHCLHVSLLAGGYRAASC